MLTKTGNALLQKQAFLMSWEKLPRDLLTLGKKLLPVKKHTHSAANKAKDLLSAAGRQVGRGADFIGRSAVNHPKYALPALAGVGAMAYKMHDMPAYEALVHSPSSGITTMSPLLSKLKFTNPSYRKYYE